MDPIFEIEVVPPSRRGDLHLLVEIFDFLRLILAIYGEVIV